MAKANRLDDVEVKETTVSKTAVVGCEKLNVRKSASLDASVVTIISEGDTVTLGKEDSDWVRVTLTDGTKGFVMKKFLR